MRIGRLFFILFLIIALNACSKNPDTRLPVSSEPEIKKEPTGEEGALDRDIAPYLGVLTASGALVVELNQLMIHLDLQTRQLDVIDSQMQKNNSALVYDPQYKLFYGFQDHQLLPFEISQFKILFFDQSSIGIQWSEQLMSPDAVVKKGDGLYLVWQNNKLIEYDQNQNVLTVLEPPALLTQIAVNAAFSVQDDLYVISGNTVYLFNRDTLKVKSKTVLLELLPELSGLFNPQNDLIEAASFVESL